MVNHPNRSKRLDKDTRLVRARAAEFEAKRQTKPQLSDTRGYEALKALNAELLAALKLVRDEYCEGGMLDATPAEKAICAAIAKAERR